MILHYDRIVEWAKANVDPFDIECVNPTSIDLRLDSQFIGQAYDNQTHSRCETRQNQLAIYPNQFYLACTFEYIKLPDNIAGLVCLKSSLARQGLDHSLAGWVDSGFEGQLTLELHSHVPVTVKAHQRIVQLVLFETTGNAHYDGHYVGQLGPTESFLKGLNYDGSTKTY